MYLRFIGIKNIGAIRELKIEPTFTDKGNPKPIVIVGENGTGKTSLLSTIVDSFYEIDKQVFRNAWNLDDVFNVEELKKNSFSALQFESFFGKKIEYLRSNKVHNSLILKMCPTFELKSDIKGRKLSTTIVSDLGYNTLQVHEVKKLRDELKNNAHFYQPAYRFEEPFWKNKNFFHNIKDDINRKKEIEIITCLFKNCQFILDLLIDENLEKIGRDNTQSTNKLLVSELNKLVRTITSKQWSVRIRGRHSREIGDPIGLASKKQEKDKKDKKDSLPSIRQLSLGQISLLNIFINILRHCDHSKVKMDNMQGIVVIDEVDTHLHSKLQSEVLPSLIKLFPKIQFILTTHSPLFILGMQREFGDEGFDLIEMPTGEKITAERFREFEEAYRVLAETKRFEDELKDRLEKKIKTMSRPKVFVEGKTDVQYLKKALELYGEEILLQDLDIEQIGHEEKGGAKNSNDKALKGAKIFLESNPEFLSQKVLILHDPETKDIKCGDFGKDGKLRISQMKFYKENPVKAGIENFFSPSFMEKCCEILGEEILGRFEKNRKLLKMEIENKKKVCDWICENGTKEDFKNFEEVIKMLARFFRDKDSKNRESK